MSNTSLTTKVQQSRGWTLALGIAAAVLAAILLIAYLVQYRSSVKSSTAETPGAGRQEPHPEGHVRHGDRREAALPGRDPRQERPQGRRDLRPGVPQRARRGRRHLPRPADHDRRPLAPASPTPSRPSSRGSSAPSRSRWPAPAASSASSRAATAWTSTTGQERAEAPFSACWPRTSSSCVQPPRTARRRSSGPTPASPRSSRLRPTRARCGSSCARPVTPRTRRRSRSRASSSSARSRDNGRPTMDRSIRALVAVEGLDVFDVQRALPDDPVVRAHRGRRRRRRDRPCPPGEGRRRGPRRLPGTRGRPVAPDHRRSAPDSARDSDRRPLDLVAERVPPAGFRGRSGGHGAVPAVEGAAAFRDEQGDHPCPEARRDARRRAARRASRLRARPEGRHGQDPDLVQPRGRARPRRAEGARHRPRPAVRRRRALPGPASREDDVRPRRLGRLPRRGQAPRLRDDARHGGRGPPRAGPARSGERDHHRAAPRRPRRGARHVRLRHRGHAARASPPRSSPPSMRAPTS